MRFLLRNRALFLLDVLGWMLIPLAALAIRLDGLVGTARYLPRLELFTAWAVVGNFLSMWRGGMYRRMWRYASLDELFGITASLAIASVVTSFVHFTLLPFFFSAYPPIAPDVPRLPHSLPVISALFAIAWSGGFRFALRYAIAVRARRRGRNQSQRALILGAGDAGSIIARELLANPQLNMEPVGFIDDDIEKHDREVYRLRVFGGRDKIAEVAARLHATTAIIAMPTAPGSTIRALRDLCLGASLTPKIIPGFEAILRGRIDLNQLRSVEIEDLLRRAPVETDRQAVGDLVRGMTVLVTGAGGSIGSELCRQIAAFGAAELVLLGHGENSIFEIHNELRVSWPDIKIRPVIADIRDPRRIEAAFRRFQPGAVFHAAAHKHVPLMEGNPEEAVTNNIGGTLNVLRAAEMVGVRHLVLISTDKAVNPTNVMGVTKLVAEKLVHEMARRTGRSYVSVRFGNVLGSRGSVIPIFKQQIAAGGPVQVTDAEMKRYFMTIPEAVQLVLQAAAIGRGGETFVLDMGEPVRIVDLARDLIELSGLRVNEDIKIEFTGSRPGEKLFEELFQRTEDFDRTAHHKIFVARNGHGPAPTERWVLSLIQAARNGDLSRIRGMLSEVAPSFPSGAPAPRAPEPRPSAATVAS